MANIDYIDKDDYTISISIANLDDVLDQGVDASNLDKDTLLNHSELTAQAEIAAYLSKIYKIDEEFEILAGSPEADTRNKLIIRCTVNLSLYNLHMTISPRDVPEKVEKAYEHCLTMLQGAQKGEFDFGLTPVEEDEQVNWRILGSNRKFISKPFDDAQVINPTTT